MLDFQGVKIGISSDGIGTKIEVAERTGVYHTLGYDLMAMIVDDLVTAGFEPTNLSNIIDVDVLERVLNVNGLGAVLDNLFAPLEMMQKLIALGNIAPATAYRYWNMGNGMLFVVDPAEVAAVLQKVAACGYQAQSAGKITSAKNIHFLIKKRLDIFGLELNLYSRDEMRYRGSTPLLWFWENAALEKCKAVRSNRSGKNGAWTIVLE